MNLVGKKIGPYKILDQIGAGGMAVVYKAEQDSLKRPVAIKELRTELAKDPSIVTRFEREALSIASLGHHNIIHVYDFVRRARSMYIVMEYVEGIDLYTLLQRSDRLPADVAGIIALQTARALEYAHFRGVIHRDIKPSNLMITKEGDVKLMDFGIARDESKEDLTLPGQALGTPAYMSPEQVLGERLDFRSDIFSFGIVLYQILTGKKPFIEDEMVGVMHAIVNKPYTKPRAVFPDIPLALQRIVKRCLQKKPEHRYQSTEDLRAALERYVAKKVRINQSGRLVIYLRHKDLITDSEAKTFVPSDQLDAEDAIIEDSGQVSGWQVVLKPILTFHVIGLVLLALGAMAIDVLAPQPGYLRVSVVPGAEIHLDGEAYDTAPLTDPIKVTPGKHLLEFRNKRFKTSREHITVQAGETKVLEVKLKR